MGIFFSDRIELNLIRSVAFILIEKETTIRLTKDLSECINSVFSGIDLGYISDRKDYCPRVPVAQNRNMVLHWVPVHIGIHGHNAVVSLSK